MISSTPKAAGQSLQPAGRRFLSVRVPGPRSGTCVHLRDTLAEEQQAGEQGGPAGGPVGCVQPLRARRGRGRARPVPALEERCCPQQTGRHCVSGRSHV